MIPPVYASDIGVCVGCIGNVFLPGTPETPEARHGVLFVK